VINSDANTRARVFVDGAVGTTGLRIVSRLMARPDIDLITLDESLRKDAQARANALNSADVAFLCLPDAAAVEAVQLVENPETVIIDASTAHRVNPAWTYGFAELAGQRDRIAQSTRIANPGCHASGFIALVAPLVQQGLIGPDALLNAVSLTGYSGGGKQMIAAYKEAEDAHEADAQPFVEGANSEYIARDVDDAVDEIDIYAGPRAYGLAQRLKHLPEMAAVCGLDNAPVFLPVVEPFYSGMMVTVPLFGTAMGITKAQVEEALRRYYQTPAGGLVYVLSEQDFAQRSDGFINAAMMFGRDDMVVTVCGNDDRMTLVSVFDNLGKGASGAALQNMNIVLGVDEATGLVVS